MNTRNASEYRPSRHRQNKCNENISTTCLIYLKFWSICPSEENGFSHEFIAPIKDEKTFSPEKHSVSAAGDWNNKHIIVLPHTKRRLREGEEMNAL